MAGKRRVRQRPVPSPAIGAKAMTDPPLWLDLLAYAIGLVLIVAFVWVVAAWTERDGV